MPYAGVLERLAHATFGPHAVYIALSTRLRPVDGLLAGPAGKCSDGGHAGWGESTHAVIYRGTACSLTSTDSARSIAT